MKHMEIYFTPVKYCRKLHHPAGDSCKHSPPPLECLSFTIICFDTGINPGYTLVTLSDEISTPVRIDLLPLQGCTPSDILYAEVHPAGNLTLARAVWKSDHTTAKQSSIPEILATNLKMEPRYVHSTQRYI